MAPKTIQGSKELGELIKNRRNELDLTIEEAAVAAGVGAKTWSRYESGESIRQDKCKGICKALNWVRFPVGDNYKRLSSIIEEYKAKKEWPTFIEEEFGAEAALSFSVGSEILLDMIIEDLSGLAAMPRHSHVGQLCTSVLAALLPEQFLTLYDYDFLFRMKSALNQLRAYAFKNNRLIAHSVIEELLIYLCNEEGKDYIENCIESDELECLPDPEGLDEWPFELFDDCDIITFLYSDLYYLTEDVSYHFIHWFDNQFYVER